MKNFTFKTEKPTGRYRSFYKNDYHIKNEWSKMRKHIL